MRMVVLFLAVGAAIPALLVAAGQKPKTREQVVVIEDDAVKENVLPPSAADKPGSTVNADDQLTTRPVARDLPNVKDLHELMEDLDKAHKRSLDEEFAESRRGVKDVEKYILAAMHPRLTVNEEAFQKYLLNMYTANQELQNALEHPVDKRALMKAQRGQSMSCKECHKVYRKKHH